MIAIDGFGKPHKHQCKQQIQSVYPSLLVFAICKL